MINGTLDLGSDTGHVFSYIKDPSGKIVSMVSFGPSPAITSASLAFEFKAGNLSGTANWALVPGGKSSTWESPINFSQMNAGISIMNGIHANTPNYTMTTQCTSLALSIGAKIGLTLPKGEGPVGFAVGGYFPTTRIMSNPYSLSQELTSRFGPPMVVPNSSFPAMN